MTLPTSWCGTPTGRPLLLAVVVGGAVVQAGTAAAEAIAAIGPAIGGMEGSDGVVMATTP